MEYYIYITHKCNLRCSFCSSRKVLSYANSSILTDDQVDNIIRYISNNNSNQNDSVVFFGGEPLIEYKIINDFIKRTAHLNLSYALYTNGLLLDSVPLDLFKSIDTIFISIDGDKDSHEKHRGLGTYRKVIGNLRKIKPKIGNFIIGRITAEEETNIFKSVENIIDCVDAVYWQIVNKPHFNDVENFTLSYKKNLSELFDFWLYHLKNNNLLNIIPFQAIISSLVFNYMDKAPSFRCDAGKSLQVIDIDGNIYWCDEYVGDKKGIVGNINNGKFSITYESHVDTFEDCKSCEVSSICLGRCKKCLKEYSLDQRRVYCNLTKYLIEMILEKIEEIRTILIDKNYDLKTFYNAPHCTEEIP